MKTDSYVQQIELGKREHHHLLDDVSDTTFNTRLHSSGWSMGEILRHVILTGEVALAEINRMTGTARAKGLTGDGAIRHSLLGIVVLWMIEPPYRLRVPAVKSLQPAAIAESKSVVIADYLRLQEQVLRAHEEARGLNLSAQSAKLPTGFPMRHGEWFAMITAHQRRHLYQIAQLKYKLERSEPS